MATAKLLVLVAPLLISAAPAPHNSTGIQTSSTVSAATDHVDHSMRALNTEYVFEEHSGACRTNFLCIPVCHGTYDKKWKDRQACENDCLNDRDCVGFEWTPGNFFADAVCEIHYEKLVGSEMGFPGSNCFIKKPKPTYRHSGRSSFCRGHILDGSARSVDKRTCERDCDLRWDCKGYSHGEHECSLWKEVDSFGDCVNLQGDKRICPEDWTCSFKLD